VARQATIELVGSYLVAPYDPIVPSNASRKPPIMRDLIRPSIVVIDGAQLAEYMIEFGVGVSDVETIKLKRLGEDYFGEE
jgi:restriction endonuclease Mrr